mgnify:CR=1 FL=1
MRWVRPGIIAFLAIGMTIGFFMSKISAEVYAPFATGLIVFWFKSRDNEKA